MILNPLYCEHLDDSPMSYEDVTPLHQLVGADALVGQLLIVVRPFTLGYRGTGYRGVLQDDHEAFCKTEPLKEGDYVEVTGFMLDGKTLFVKPVEMPVNSVTDIAIRAHELSERNENKIEAQQGQIFRLMQDMQWLKDRLLPSGS